MSTTGAAQKRVPFTVSVQESSPLLERPEDILSEETQAVSSNPLPRAQLAIIYGIKLVVPIANTQVMPYVNKMVASMDLPGGRSVGYYSGLLSMGHTAGQFLTIFFWGRLSGICNDAQYPRMRSSCYSPRSHRAHTGHCHWNDRSSSLHIPVRNILYSEHGTVHPILE